MYQYIDTSKIRNNGNKGGKGEDGRTLSEISAEVMVVVREFSNVFTSSSRSSRRRAMVNWPLARSPSRGLNS